MYSKSPRNPAIQQHARKWILVTAASSALAACGGGDGAAATGNETTATASAVSADGAATQVNPLTSAETTPLQPVSSADNTATATATLTPSLTYEVNPADLPAPGAGKHLVRFSGGAVWKSANASLKDSTAEIDKWAWSFGANVQFPIFTYSGNGPYTVQLTVTDKYGKEATVEQNIAFPIINATSPSPAVFESISFWISNAYQAVKTVLWNFGSDIQGGTPVTVDGVGTSASHAFTTSGPKTVSVTLKDAAGNVLGQEQATITISAAATITGAASNSATHPGAIASNGTTNDAMLTLSGTLGAALTSGQKVNVYDGDNMFSAVAVVNGTDWTFTPATPLNNGMHSFTVEVARFDGISSGRSQPYVVNVLFIEDTTVPPAQGPIVFVDNATNTVIGYDPLTMEASLNGINWSSALPDLSGTKSLYIRKKAMGINPAGPATLLKFTANVVAPVVPANMPTSFDVNGASGSINLASYIPAGASLRFVSVADPGAGNEVGSPQVTVNGPIATIVIPRFYGGPYNLPITFQLDNSAGSSPNFIITANNVIR